MNIFTFSYAISCFLGFGEAGYAFDLNLIQPNNLMRYKLYRLIVDNHGFFLWSSTFVSIDRTIFKFLFEDLIQKRVVLQIPWKNDGHNLDGDMKNAIWEKLSLIWCESIKPIKPLWCHLQASKTEKPASQVECDIEKRNIRSVTNVSQAVILSCVKNSLKSMWQ